ncbi:MAG: hypothetical protein IPK82_23310 [Polyangiaceae bacterium]|nr:hypothetical protein [Polyangiaceae bacterium]
MISVTKTPTAFIATATVRTVHGPVYVRVETTRLAASELARLLPQLQPVVGAGFFEDMSKTFDTVMRSKAFGQAARTVEQIASNPLVQTAATAALGPGGAMLTQTLSRAGQAAQAAQRIVKRARAGDRGALDGMKQVMSKAKKGDPAAINGAAMMAAAFRLQKNEPITSPTALPPAVPLGIPLNFEDYQTQTAAPPLSLQETGENEWSL